jgi:hypothetical protein
VLTAPAFPTGADTSQEPDDQTLVRLLTAKTKQEGGPVPRVVRVLGERSNLTRQQQQEVRERLKQGEPIASIARGYRCDIAAIQTLAGRG